MREDGLDSSLPPNLSSRARGDLVCINCKANIEEKKRKGRIDEKRAGQNNLASEDDVLSATISI